MQVYGIQSGADSSAAASQAQPASLDSAVCSACDAAADSLTGPDSVYIATGASLGTGKALKTCSSPQPWSLAITRNAVRFATTSRACRLEQNMQCTLFVMDCLDLLGAAPLLMMMVVRTQTHLHQPWRLDTCNHSSIIVETDDGLLCRAGAAGARGGQLLCRSGRNPGRAAQRQLLHSQRGRGGSRCLLHSACSGIPASTWQAPYLP